MNWLKGSGLIIESASLSPVSLKSASMVLCSDFLGKLSAGSTFTASAPTANLLNIQLSLHEQLAEIVCSHLFTLDACGTAILELSILASITLMLLVANLANTKCCKKPIKMTESLAHMYSSKSSHRELSNEYQHDRLSMFFSKIFAFLCFG